MAAAAGLPSWLADSQVTYRSYIHGPTITTTSSIPQILSCTDASRQTTWNADQ